KKPLEHSKTVRIIRLSRCVGARRRCRKVGSARTEKRSDKCIEYPELILKAQLGRDLPRFIAQVIDGVITRDAKDVGKASLNLDAPNGLGDCVATARREQIFEEGAGTRRKVERTHIGHVAVDRPRAFHLAQSETGQLDLPRISG